MGADHYDAGERLVPTVIRQLRLGQEVQLGEGQQFRDFIYVDDVAEAVARLLGQGAGGVFNLGTGIGTSVRDIALMIADHFDAAHLLRFGALEERVEPATLVADVTKLRHTLSWLPEIQAKLGIASILAGTAAL